jgi:RimJ/RimL family protein N-acetyltransferase
MEAQTARIMATPHPVVLASGRSFDPGAYRSLGVLDGEQLAYCRTQGIPLAYDPVQIGWVSSAADDDLSGQARPHVDVPSRAQQPAGLVRIAARVGLASASHLSFRRWHVEDAPLYASCLGNERLWKYLPERPPVPFTEDMARALIEVLGLESRHDVVAILVDGAPVGQARLLFDEPRTPGASAEVSYWIAEEYWGRGFGASAVSAYTRQCFDRFQVDLIYAWIRLDHTASIRTAERAGYRRDHDVDPRQLAEPRRAGCGRWIRTRHDVQRLH